MSSSRLLFLFGRMLREEKIAKIPLERLKRMWDELPDDGGPHPSGFDCDDIHAELNRRGEGDYCRV